MSALKTAFDKAMDDSKNLSERPDNATLLKIYALYKQASTGDNEEKKAWLYRHGGPCQMGRLGQAQRHVNR